MAGQGAHCRKQPFGSTPLSYDAATGLQRCGSGVRTAYGYGVRKFDGGCTQTAFHRCSTMFHDICRLSVVYSYFVRLLNRLNARTVQRETT
jgi:hypothetical protein